MQHLLKKPVFVTILASLSAFGTYLCFYPFRRAYTAGTYQNLSFLNIDFKILMISAQVLGFAVSKGIGVRIISEMKAEQRPKAMLTMILLATFFYILFGMVPAPYNLIFIFLANLPLGLFYGTILGFLEGRQITDFLVAVLTSSFIIGSGFAKSVGSWVLNTLDVPLFWMPAISAILMLIPVSFFIYLLSLIPAPTSTDYQTRSPRKALLASERRVFFGKYKFGLIMFILSYVLLTTFREFRDNFTPEIWASLGNKNSSIFTQTEVPIAILVLGLMAGFNFLKSNIKAFKLIESIMFLGGVFIVGFTALYQFQLISPYFWIVGVGLGNYLAYSMSNSLYFERLIGSFKESGRVGYLITMADYYAYFGSLSVLFLKNYLKLEFDYLQFFIYLSYTIGLSYCVIMGLSMIYFNTRLKEIKR